MSLFVNWCSDVFVIFLCCTHETRAIKLTIVIKEFIFIGSGVDKETLVILKHKYNKKSIPVGMLLNYI